MKLLLILAGLPEVRVGQCVPVPVMAPPLTLLLLAAICRRFGHEVELIDTRFFMTPHREEWVVGWDVLSRHISSAGAEVAGISFLSSSAEDGFRVAELCRRHGLTVIGGGLHASVALDEFTVGGCFDYVIQGEAEETLPRLLADLAAGRCPRSPETTVVLKAGVTRDLSLLPEVEDLEYYRAVYEQWPEYRTLYVETSRGCFKECTFCEVAKTGAAWSPFRKVPLDTVFRTIAMGVESFGVNYILVADSIATLYKGEFIQLMQQVGSRWPGVAVQFNSTVDCWDPERAEACRDVPCTVWFGFESGSPRILEIIRKGTTVEKAYGAAGLCQAYEIPCAFNVLLGVPGETEADYAQTLEVFKRCPWVYPNPNIFNPLPGTALHSYCSANGLLRAPRDYSIWDAEKIRSRAAGPVRGVDYDLVLHNHARLTQMQAEPLRSLSRS